MSPETALLAATAVHLGFQLVVTTVVYPALAAVTDESWVTAHAAHSSRIAVVVAPLYLTLAAVGLWVLLDADLTAVIWLALAGTGVACFTTALVAAPAHGRLGRDGRAAALMTSLRWADAVRTVGAAVALVAAAVAV
ncbi:hypothetical protein HMPREF0063_11976 [Aeromicrobium marinum DSM 15272]|uniref:DUF1772 domain-containing protein n=1 Tax=Aeromicrobium marinum DSM 15272 TaxID=585531 RepID=E2SE40_9ACTN|nr:hypothetical protein [Aeromicrobium marinum]EFQ82767.1 hypothetical protein HMPREF0063_11976 [Aeromicrobium marinum DSM 15272]